MDLREEVKVRLRIKSAAFDDAEIQPLVQACESDLLRVGVFPDESEALVRQAVVLYCKANFGLSDDPRMAERFQKAYEALRDALALSSSLGV